MKIKRLSVIISFVVLLFASQAQAEERLQGDPVKIDPEARLWMDLTAGISTPVSGNDYIDSLLFTMGTQGIKWHTNNITYSFYKSGWNATHLSSYYNANNEVVFEPSNAIKENFRAIFKDIGNLTNINFTEKTETIGNANSIGHIRIQCAAIGGYAYAYLPTTTSDIATFHGDVFLNINYDVAPDGGNSFQNPPGTHGYGAMAHELGHSLGLKHPHDEIPYLLENNNFAWTIMTYNWDNSNSASGTFMYYDAMALHFLYGVKALNTTDTTYTFTRIDTFSTPGGTSLPNAGTGTYRQILHDTGGTDTLDLSALSVIYPAGYRIDLDDTYDPDGSGYEWGAWITHNDELLTATEGLTGSADTVPGTYFYRGVAIGPETIIENVKGSPSDDHIYANSAANEFIYDVRQHGDDFIYGADSSDYINFSAFTSATLSQVGNDYYIDLGSNGSITIVDYYISTDRPVLNSPPVISALTYSLGADPVMFFNKPIAFSAVAYDPESAPLTYTWSALPSVGVTINPNASTTANNTAITFASAGTYIITVSVDDQTTTPATKSITVTVYDNGDADGDGIPDYWEDINGLNKADPADAPLDPDSDGLNNLGEFNNQTKPYISDTDNDGALDGEEVNGLVLTINGTSATYTSDPNVADTDGDTLADGLELKVYLTNPNSADSDSDTMPDAWEVAKGIDANDNDTAADPDSDGLTNIQEYRTNGNYTHPMLPDTDNDGLLDGTEDANGDGARTDPETDPLLWDTDNDGMRDGWEVDNTLDPLDPTDGTEDPDDDGQTNKDEHDMGTDPHSAEEFGALGIGGISGCTSSANGSPITLLLVFGMLYFAVARSRRVDTK